MAVNWTDEQKKVIDARNRNLLVAAAAGSGKTAVLVERILSLLTDEKDPLSVDQLLVVTFTRAAAAQMRERIGEALRARLQEHPENIHLQRQMTLLHYAQITTIDSFCLTVLREHFEELDLDPDFRIGDEGELKLVRGDLIEKLMEDAYAEGSEDFHELIESMSVGKTDGGIAELIEQLYFFVSSYPFPEKLLDAWAEGDTVPLDETAWMQCFLTQIRREAKELSDQYEDAANTCLLKDGLSPYAAMFRQDKFNADRIASAGNYDELQKALAGMTFVRKPTIRVKNTEEFETFDLETRERMSAFRDARKKTMQKWQKQYLYPDREMMEQEIRDSQGPIRTLCRLTGQFLERFAAYKREKHLVDFTDVEHMVLQILVTEDEDGSLVPTDVARQMQNTYREVMIDEYQDSNLVQELLLSSVAGHWIGRPDRFMVGDVKQSIYKFRMARPEIFMEKYATYTDEESENQKIDLHMNFRSRPEVLDAANFVFRQLMTEPVGGIAYDERSALYAGAAYPDRLAGEDDGEDREDYRTELLLVDLDDRGSAEDLAGEGNAVDPREAEAKAIAGRIRRLTDPETGLQLWDSSLGAYRTAGYGDIVILLRTFTGWAEPFVNVLLNAGIPAYAQSSTGYFTALEVQTVLNVLRILDNPMQDIPMAAVMHSPIGGFTSEELALVRGLWEGAGCPGTVRGLYGACRYVVSLAREGETGQAVDAKTAALAEKTDAFFKEMESFRREAMVQPLHELLQRIYDRTGYYELVSVMPDGAVRQANLDMLMEKAVAYESTSYYGLFDFVRYIENLHKYDVDFGEAAPEGEGGDTVRITSIHKSKGLEYPIVFVAGMGKSFNTQDTKGRILMHPDLGLAADFMDPSIRLRVPTLKKQVIAKQLLIDSLGEELRVLYVAMTRAREKLILSGTGKSLAEKLCRDPGIPGTASDPVPSSSILEAGSYLDWIWLALARERGDRWMSDGTDVWERSAPSAPIRTSVVPVSDLFEVEVERQIRRKKDRWELEHWNTERVYDADARREMEERLSFVYPHAADETLPMKVSVSELKHAAMDEEAEAFPLVKITEPEEAKPRFLQEHVELVGAARGTVCHKVMERVDLPQLVAWGEAHDEDALASLLASWQAQKILTEEEAASVNIRQILRFSVTKEARAMAAADADGLLWREKPFVMGLPAEEVYPGCGSQELVVVQGIIDACWQEEDGMHILDYKTDAVTRKDGERVLTARYAAQMRLYSRALTQATGLPVRSLTLYSFAMGKAIALETREA